MISIQEALWRIKKYEIHLKGHLSQDWADWLDCMQICCLENGEMVLSGLLADQAALLGVLNKLSCLNLMHSFGQRNRPERCRPGSL